MFQGRLDVVFFYTYTTRKSEASRYESTSGRIIYRLRKKIPRIRWFFQFQQSFLGYTIRSSKFQETYFLPIKRVRIKLGNDKYENKSLCA